MGSRVWRRGRSPQGVLIGLTFSLGHRSQSNKLEMSTHRSWVTELNSALSERLVTAQSYYSPAARLRIIPCCFFGRFGSLPMSVSNSPQQPCQRSYPFDFDFVEGRCRNSGYWQKVSKQGICITPLA